MKSHHHLQRMTSWHEKKKHANFQLLSQVTKQRDFKSTTSIVSKRAKNTKRFD